MNRLLAIFLALLALFSSAFWLFENSSDLFSAVKIITGSFLVAILIYCIDSRKQIIGMQKRKRIVLTITLLAAVLTAIFNFSFSYQFFAALKAQGIVFGLFFGWLFLLLEIIPKKEKDAS